MTAEATSPPRVELEEERDFLLASLRDLEREHEVGDIDHADYLALRDDYTARAAAVLRALGPQDDTATGSEPDPRPAGLASRPGVLAADRTRARWRAPVLAAAVVAFALGAGALVARSSGERVAGDPVSGAITPTGPSDGLARARALIAGGRTLDAIRAYDGILAVVPTQPEALAYRGWLVRLAGRAAGDVGLVDKGIEYLKRAVAADPAYPDAHFFLGYALYQDRGDAAAAVVELRAFLASGPPPDMTPAAEDVLRRALADSRPPTSVPSK